MHHSMSRHRVSPILLCGLGLFLASLMPTTPEVAAQPNIVFIVVDDAGYEDFGFMGSTEIPTPNLDALANAGVMFSQAHTGQACSPSRGAFLTGSFHNRFGYEANLQNTDDPITEHVEGLPNSAVTMFERLKAEGYSTSVTGKWHVGGTRDIVSGSTVVTPGNIPIRQGVDLFEGFQAGGGLQRMFENPDGTANITSYSSSDWTNHWTDNTIDYIDDHYQDADPFFIYTSYNDPHSPIQATPIINDGRLNHLTGQRKTYASEVVYIDDNVGRIVDKLEDPNGDGNTADSIMDNTMIVFINDNGGATQNSASNGNLRDSKGSPYDGGTRVPMFISGAGVDPSAAGTTFEKLVHSVDIVPTMVAAAGGSIAAGEIDGVNLLPFINGQDTSNPRTYYAQRLQEEIYYRNTDWKLIKNGYAGDWELYDFSDINNQSEDPSDNVAASNPAQVAVMQRLLTDWEVTIDKQRFPSTDESIGQFNLFDDFTFAQTSTNFSATNGWLSPGSTTETMRDRDSHNGTVFHFGVSNSSDYTATNDLRRMSEMDFIAHGFEFEGNFVSATQRKATVNGLPVLLAKNLDDELPYIHLSATAGGAETFEFELGMNTQLYDDLNITGDGTQDFKVTGDITEYRTGRTITKTGSAKIAFAGRVEATGPGYLAQGGTTHLESTATLGGDLDVSSGATVEHDGVIEGSVNNDGVFDVGSPDFAGGPTIQVINLVATHDNRIRTDAQTGNSETTTSDLIGSVTASRNHYAALGFDLSSIPDSQTILSVSLDATFDPDGSGSSANTNDGSGDILLVEMLENPDRVNGWNYPYQSFGPDQTGNTGDEVAWVGGNGGNIGAVLSSVADTTYDPEGIAAGTAFSWATSAGFVSAVQNNLVDDEILLQVLASGLHPGGRSFVRSNNDFALNVSIEVINSIVARVDGDFTQSATGSLLFDLRSASDFDQLDIIGGLSVLGGSLDVSLVGGFAPQLGDVFDLLDFGSATGAFDTLNLPTLGAGLAWDNSQLLITGELSVVAALAGDLDGDGFVGLADLDIILNNWNQNVPPGNPLADPTGDGFVGLADLDIVLNNWNAGTPPSAQANIPEPASAVMLFILSGLGMHIRRHR